MSVSERDEFPAEAEPSNDIDRRVDVEQVDRLVASLDAVTRELATLNETASTQLALLAQMLGLAQAAAPMMNSTPMRVLGMLGRKS